MRAITIPEPGDRSVLTLAELPDPVPGPGQVLLDVVATAVNRADILQRQGHYPPPPGAPAHPGLECSGVVAGLGDGVEEWRVGDQVCALLSGGGYGERVVVPAGQLLPVPAGVSLVAAAALPEVVCTVWSNVFMLADLRAGESFLVHGGGSGIGTAAIQLARAFGARVFTTAGSEAKLARCRELGAELAVDYRSGDFVKEVRAATDGAGVDVLLDNMGGSHLDRNVAALARGGRLAVIGLQGGRRGELDLGRLLAKGGTVTATSLRARPADEKATIVASVLEHVWPKVAAGQVAPVVDRVLPLEEASEAHRVVEASEHVGKVVLRVK